MTWTMKNKKKNKVGRPRKTNPLSTNTTIVVSPAKRGRGRPRKYPIREPPKLLELTKEPGMASSWGNIKKGKRVIKFRNKKSSGILSPGSEESGSGRSGLTDSKEIGCDIDDDKESLSWLSEMVIPGPIPDLEALFSGQNLSKRSDLLPGFFDLQDYDFL